ncbi:hypothetical protein EWM64_g1994 [Hericium alpestre]|uniref:NAD(P)-binding protein n=1 Tax=Hericium alpestre TaxID=135208 RepID=A0A4Z0A4Q2_9AGAM|nr:hypothetical protein EWM64_g1994 [Hericium alpestre]
MGNYYSVLWDESFPPKPKWGVHDIPDLTGKIALVTGGSAGIGKETVKVLLNKGAKVYIASRGEQKAREAIQELKTQTGREARFVNLDLGDLKSIKRSAEKFLSQETQLNLLILNGGVMTPPVELLTADGYDMQFGINVLGHYYLTTLLLPVLLATANANPHADVCVTTLTSSAHRLTAQLDFATLRDCEKRRKKGTQSLYSQSKFGNVLFAKELARRYKDQGILSNCVHPGIVKTDLQRHLTRFQHWFLDLLLYDVSYGVLTSLYAATAPEAKGLHGAYFMAWARLGKAHRGTEDPQLARALWTWMEEQVKDL